MTGVAIKIPTYHRELTHQGHGARRQLSQHSNQAFLSLSQDLSFLIYGNGLLTN